MEDYQDLLGTPLEEDLIPGVKRLFDELKWNKALIITRGGQEEYTSEFKGHPLFKNVMFPISVANSGGGEYTPRRYSIGNEYTTESITSFEYQLQRLEKGMPIKP